MKWYYFTNKLYADDIEYINAIKQLMEVTGMPETGGDIVILNGSKCMSIKGTMESYKLFSSCWTEVYICNKYNKYICVTTELM